MAAMIFATTLSRPVTLVALLVASLLAFSLALWGYYGTAVFLEMVRAGWAACF